MRHAILIILGLALAACETVRPLEPAQQAKVWECASSERRGGPGGFNECVGGWEKQ